MYVAHKRKDVQTLGRQRNSGQVKCLAEQQDTVAKIGTVSISFSFFFSATVRSIINPTSHFITNVIVIIIIFYLQTKFFFKPVLSKVVI